MKTIGMVGGLTWVSTAHYYQRLNEIVAERVGGPASAKLVLASVDRADYVKAYLENGDEDAAGQVVLDAALSAERACADFLIICCNNAHRFVPMIEKHLRIPILHIAEATAIEAREAGMSKLALLGIRTTMENPFYADILRRYGIETIIPEEPDRTYINDKIYDEMVKNVFTDETRRGYIGVMETLRKRGAEGIVLGCTEIPLLIRPGDTVIPTFATTEIHCQAAVSAALQ